MLKSANESESYLVPMNSSKQIYDREAVLEKREQMIDEETDSKTVGDQYSNLLKVLDEEKSTYIKKVINNKPQHAKLSKHKKYIYFHAFRLQKVSDDKIFTQVGQIVNMITKEASLVFLELTLGGTVKGSVILRIDKNLPNIRQNTLQIVTGQFGISMTGVAFNRYHDDSIGAYRLPFRDMPVECDSDKKYQAERGDVVGFFCNGYLQHIYFNVASFEYASSWCVIGTIKEGMDIIQECHDKCTSGVKISDCGLVIENYQKVKSGWYEKG